MRRHSGIILLFAAAALLAGCAKESNNKASANGEPVIFTATIASSKTALSVEGSTGKMTWEDGDEITINGVAYVATPDATNPAKATFAPKGIDEAEPVNGRYYAAYACVFDAAEQTGTMPDEQVYAANSLAAVAPMYAESTSTELAFENLCSLLEITLKGDAEVAAITLSSNNLPMCGEFIFDEDGKLFMTEESHDVTLDCGGAQLTSAGTKFYVAVPAGEYWQLKVKVTDTAGKVWKIVTPAYARIAGNKIYPIAFTPVFAEDILLDGAFAINADGGKVRFVKGNLVNANGTYSIADDQTGSGSLFSSSEFSALDLSSISSEPIRTLTVAEWRYLLLNTNTAKLYSISGKNGILLIPNDADVNSSESWATLEENGAVFLPAAGYAYGDSAVCGLNEGGSYWADGSSLDFDACEIYTDAAVPAAIKESVRFVVDVVE